MRRPRHDCGDLGRVVVIQSGVDLVGQQQLRPGQQRTCQRDARRLATRQTVRRPVQLDVAAAQRIQHPTDRRVVQTIGCVAVGTSEQ